MMAKTYLLSGRKKTCPKVHLLPSKGRYLWEIRIPHAPVIRARSRSDGKGYDGKSYDPEAAIEDVTDALFSRVYDSELHICSSKKGHENILRVVGIDPDRPGRPSGPWPKGVRVRRVR